VPPKTKAAKPRIRRPRQERSAVTVEAILDAVDRLVEERGVTAVTAKEIARRAGVSPGSLYQYFRDREAIVAAWEVRELERALSILADDVERALGDSSLYLEDVIRQLTRKTVGLVFAHIDRGGDPRSTFAERAALIDRFAQAIASALPKVASPHRLRHLAVEADLERAARIVVLIVTLLPAGLTSVSLPPHQRGAIADEMAELIVRYLVLDPRAP
jgi:AcrR family transcriptional regulator